MKRDAHLREALVRSLLVEPDRRLAGEILERWDELIEKERLAAERDSEDAT